MLMKSPILLVMAGPNGSGKSTVTEGVQTIGDYVNADDIKLQLGCTDLEAAQIAESTREALLSEDKDFTFETVLSTPRNIDLMSRAKEKGYNVICIYVLTNNPNINVNRVLKRARNNGHDVPPEKVVSRYVRAMTLIPKLLNICDELYIFDNSAERGKGEASLIAKYKFGELHFYPNSFWSQEMLNKLINGEYYQNSISNENL